jgi:hypothetical protein
VSRSVGAVSADLASACAPRPGDHLTSRTPQPLTLGTNIRATGVEINMKCHCLRSGLCAICIAATAAHPNSYAGSVVPPIEPLIVADHALSSHDPRRDHDFEVRWPTESPRRAEAMISAGLPQNPEQYIGGY